MKYDSGKPPIHLVPPEVIIELATVLKFGAEKYGENNWRRDIDKFPVSRHYDSLQRHLLAFISGEDNDQESGLPHISHAFAQLMILMMTMKESDLKATDDRFKHEESK